MTSSVNSDFSARRRNKNISFVSILYHEISDLFIHYLVAVLCRWSVRLLLNHLALNFKFGLQHNNYYWRFIKYLVLILLYWTRFILEYYSLLLSLHLSVSKILTPRLNLFSDIDLNYQHETWLRSTALFIINAFIKHLSWLEDFGREATPSE